MVIHTSTVPGACTQASATVKMVFKSAVIEHDVHADPDDFARGGEAHIVVKCLEQGSIQELWVGHNNEGAAVSSKPPDHFFVLSEGVEHRELRLCGDSDVQSQTRPVYISPHPQSSGRHLEVPQIGVQE